VHGLSLKSTRKLCLSALWIAVCPLLTELPAQDVVASGQWKHFQQEHPPLSYSEITTPITVRDIRGIITYGDGGKPLEAAYFEIGLKDGVTLGTVTSATGQFELLALHLLGPLARSTAIDQGTYRFKVTKDGFHSAVGTVIVSRNASKQSKIAIELKPGEDYQQEQPKEAPNEQLLPQSSVASFVVRNPKKYPQKYAAVYMPVSLAGGRVRTPEFTASKSQWYAIALQFEVPLLPLRMRCMTGATLGPLDANECEKDERVLRADWTVWEDGRIAYWGSIPDEDGGKWGADMTVRVGNFGAVSGKRYVVQVHFTTDGSPLNIANPHLIVIPHKDMW
jgi:hypothetical protein